jgi:hypothetical protein
MKISYGLMLLVLLGISVTTISWKGVAAAEFLYQVPVLDQAGISKLTDEQLINAYIDAMVELEATTIFQGRAGFNPKEFDKYKRLLRYSVDLNLEIQKRKLELPDLKILNNRN